MRQFLAQPAAYNLLQRVVGADRLRHRCIDQAAICAGETVVDVGCGPAYYFDRLPSPIDYHGFDTSEHYIIWANKKWGDRGNFHLGTLDRQSAEAVGYLAMLRSFVAELEPPASRRQTLRGLLSPELSVEHFDAVVEDAEARERSCIAGDGALAGAEQL